MVQTVRTRALGTAPVLAGLLFCLAPCACYTESNTEERLEEPLVITAHDDGMQFGSIRSFFIRPEVPVIAQSAVEGAGGGAGENLTLSPPLAEPLVAATEENLLARGYVRAARPAEADMAVALAYLRELRSDYDCYGYWSDWSYWGYPGSYPYSAPYSCSEITWTSSMLVTDVIDMAAVPRPVPSDAGTAPPAPGILRGFWFSGVYGVEMGSQRNMMQRAVEGIDQAFAQSPYFTRTP